jgi:aryl carrier-like protein
MDQLQWRLGQTVPTEATESTPFEEPREGLEEAVARVWRDVFRVERLGRNDNFFELGGNSLLGMDLTELLATRLGISVSVVMLFQNPTIRGLAEAVEWSDVRR